LSLSPSEHDFLVQMLTAAMKEKRVEIHRTEFSREYRQQLEAEESQIRDMLGRLTATTNVGA
jgi:hypothetical protein